MEISGPLIYNTILNDFINSKKGYLIGRMGNVEISSILANKITSKLMNNAGFYYTSENTKDDEFNDWKNLYEKAIKNSNAIFHVFTCPSFQITMDYMTLNNIYHPILPYREDCNFYLEILNYLTVKKNIKVGIVSYFKDDIDNQLKNINLINNDYEINPLNIVTIKSYQSINGNKPHSCFSETLYTLKKECLKEDIKYYFIACGCYGMPLAHYLKENNKNVIYLGGILQCLFGLIGKRWENRENIKNRINGYWKRPEKKPLNYENVENGCYW